MTHLTTAHNFNHYLIPPEKEPTMALSYKFKTLQLTVTVDSIESLQKLADKLGEPLNYSNLPVPKGYYYSQSKRKLLEITKMDTIHLRRAAVKSVRSYLDGLGQKAGTLTHKEFYAQFVNPILDDQGFALLLELRRRGEAL